MTRTYVMSRPTLSQPEPTESQSLFRNGIDPASTQVQRERRVIRIAIDYLGVTKAEAFLSEYDEILRGYPLLIAAQSQEGAEMVERIMVELDRP